MKKNQFKARPFRQDLCGVGGEKGVFRPQRSNKQLTMPAPFRLSTDGRVASRTSSSELRSQDDEELAKQFKARPMPSGRSSSVGKSRLKPAATEGAGAGQRRPQQQELTVAASPMLSTKRRSALRGSLGGVSRCCVGIKSSDELEMEKVHQFKARPMPDYSRLSSQAR
ncbi:unnamed protein product [Discosporangium mesarthrocarpum]